MVLPHFDEHLEKYANLLIKKGGQYSKGTHPADYYCCRAPQACATINQKSL